MMMITINKGSDDYGAEMLVMLIVAATAATAAAFSLSLSFSVERTCRIKVYCSVFDVASI